MVVVSVAFVTTMSLVASQGFAQCDVVEADLSINQIIIEINQFAAGVRHLDGLTLPVPEMAFNWARCSWVSVMLSEPAGTVIVMVDASFEAGSLVPGRHE